MSEYRKLGFMHFFFGGKGYVYLTGFVAIFLSAIPWGFKSGVPDFVGLVILFWGVTRPHWVSLPKVFLLGLLIDVQSGVVLGQNALVYTLQAYIAISLHHRMEWLGTGAQMLYIFPILMLSQVVEVGLNFVLGNELLSAWFFMSSVVGAMLWPPLSLLLSSNRLFKRQRG